MFVLLRRAKDCTTKSSDETVDLHISLATRVFHAGQCRANPEHQVWILKLSSEAFRGPVLYDGITQRRILGLAQRLVFRTGQGRGNNSNSQKLGLWLSAGWAGRYGVRWQLPQKFITSARQNFPSSNLQPPSDLSAVTIHLHFHPFYPVELASPLPRIAKIERTFVPASVKGLAQPQCLAAAPPST